MEFTLERVGGFTVRGDDEPSLALARVGGRWHALIGTDDDATVQLWDLERCERMARMPGHAWKVTAMAATVVDGRPVAVSGGGDDDFSVRLWDLAERRELAVLAGHGDTVYGIGCAEVDGRPLAVTGSWDRGPVRVWDLRQRRQIGVLEGHAGRVHAVACTRIDGRPHAVTTGYDDHALRVWDLTTLRQRAALEGHNGPVFAVACVEVDGRTLAVSTSADGWARFWDLTPGGERQFGMASGHTRYYPIGAACLVVDGRPVAVTTGWSDHRLQLWDMLTIEQLGTVEGLDEVGGALAAAEIDGRPHIVSTAPHGGVGVWTWK